MCTNPNEIQQTQKYSKKRPLIHGKKPKNIQKNIYKNYKNIHIYNGGGWGTIPTPLPHHHI